MSTPVQGPILAPPRQVARPDRRPAPGARPRALAAALGLACLWACARESSEPAQPPNVVLLVLDTVRADHLSCYGYERPTTPRIDRLAAASDRFAEVESTAPWTLPSHASMFTGRFAFQHGTHAWRGSDGQIFDGRPLASEHETLAEALGACGYQTAGFVANNVYLSAPFNVNQGFEVWDVERLRARAMNAKLLRWLDARDASRPFFAFVNYMDAHRPYNVDPLPEEAAGVPRPDLPAPAGEPSAELLDGLYEEVLARGEPADADAVAKVITQYDNGIAWLDVAVGEVVEALRARGLFEDALLIVTSDHGEYFGEHQLIEHSKDVYEPALHVPLIVKHPRQAQGRVVRERSSLADLPGIVMSDLPEPMRRAHGGAFGVRGDLTPVVAEVHFTRGKDLAQPFGARFMRERWALFAGGHKYILSSDGHNELYDLASDPDEVRDLSSEKASLAKALEVRLRALLESGPAANTLAPAVEYSPEQLAELKRLGYL